jgi:hypothetical protein
MPNAQWSSLFHVPSTLFNSQLILKDWLGTQAGCLLGVAWQGHVFEPSTTLPEFELRMLWSDYAMRLDTRSGIRAEYWADDPDDEAWNRVELGQPVIVAVDSHDLPHRPAYRRVHSARTVIVWHIDRINGSATITDVWPPSYQGTIPLADLARARASKVPYDPVREPLYSGTPLNRRWWCLALKRDTPLAHASAGFDLLRTLAAEALPTDVDLRTPAVLDRFRESARDTLSRPLGESRSGRRSAAMYLRAELGLRAYLAQLLVWVAQSVGDTLLAEETNRWLPCLDAMALARDILIKSTAFDRSEYVGIADRALTSAIARERRMLQFLAEYFELTPPG